MSEVTRSERLRKLLALEIDRLLDDLERRRDFLLAIWGEQRARAPFLDTAFSRWKTLGFGDLALLDVAEVVLVNGFYRELEDLRLYLAHTSDMPRSLSVRYDAALDRLQQLGGEALGALGGTPPLPFLKQGESMAWFGAGDTQEEE